jgi:hypothetical protein
LKEEALDRTQWRTRFGRGYGPVVRQTTEWMNLRHQSKILVLHTLIFTFFGSDKKITRLQTISYPAFIEFQMLLTFSWMEFWFVSVSPKYLNFPPHYQSIQSLSCCDCILHSGNETWTYSNLYFCTII